jgi:hypothetical protein
MTDHPDYCLIVRTPTDMPSVHGVLRGADRTAAVHYLSTLAGIELAHGHQSYAEHLARRAEALRAEMAR